MKKFYGSCIKCGEEVERGLEHILLIAVCFSCKKKRADKYGKKYNKNYGKKKNGKAQN